MAKVWVYALVPRAKDDPSPKRYERHHHGMTVLAALPAFVSREAAFDYFKQTTDITGAFARAQSQGGVVEIHLDTGDPATSEIVILEPGKQPRHYTGIQIADVRWTLQEQMKNAEA